MSSYFKSWDWPAPKVYNGFTGEERIRGWKFTWWLRDMGIIPKYPKNCSICDATDGVNYHNENYAAPERVKPVCKKCHLAIHKRFKEPENWIAIVEQNRKSQDSQEWFTKLSLEEVDLAGALRGKFGEEVMDLFKGLKKRGVIDKSAVMPKGDY